MALDVKERDRRYNLIKEKMAAMNLDALVVINSAQINEKGFVKYLTNYRSILYNLVVVFPLNGEPRCWSPAQSKNIGRVFWAG